MKSASTVVITHERDEHLLRQQDALARESGWDEAVVCFMDQPTEPWPQPPARVRTIHLDGPDLNLAAARNTAARVARSEVLVFLDVDCLPAPGAVTELAAQCRPGRVVMADPHYLPPGWEPPADPVRAAQPHPRRTDLPRGRSDQWHMFWSLGFAMRADDFWTVGGFDEAFRGYGGEDTDFAFRCRDASLELWLSRARVLHQAHAVHRPPLQHLSSIVVNAHRFHDRWGTWPMEGWLTEFADRGLVSLGPDHLDVVRLPTDEELAASLVPDAAFG